MKARMMITILTLVLVPSFLFPGVQQKDRRFFKMGIEDRIMSILDSTQAKQWAEQRLKYQQEVNVLQAAVKNARLQLRYLLSTERLPDANAVKNAQEKIDEQTSRLHLKRIERQLALRKILTDEQWEKLSEMRKAPNRREFRSQFRRGFWKERQGLQKQERQ